MTNEMLADRVGLLPIHVKDPQHWNNDEYQFTLKVDGDKDRVRYVTSGDFKIKSMIVSDEDDHKEISTEQFFPKNPLTGQTCLIATLQPGTGPSQQSIEIVAKATKGTGREHARFCPVSQCSYEYTLDNNPQRLDEMFVQWMAVAKKVVNVDKASERYAELQREFNTMQRKRCFLLNQKGEPYSFDFTVESVGVLDVSYIVERACEVAENICLRYVNLDKGDLPDDISLSTADSRVIGYDFLFRGHDHTLGNLFQTWMVENLIETANPSITYVGYSVPHPLRDEMILRVGVEDGKESTARGAVASAAKGCQELFRNLRTEWRKLMGLQQQSGIQVNVRRRTPIVGSR
jgi:DNA-directed RNA polymerase subunit L